MAKQASSSVRKALEAKLATFPRVPLAHVPTPLEECPRLSEALGGARILIKRDDATALAFGGNKVRHFEYQMGEIKAGGYDAYVNVMDFLSNNARLSAAACVKAGIRYILVVRRGKGKPIQGNLLIDSLLGTEFHFLETNDYEEADAYAKKLGDSLRAEGCKPYVLPEQEFPNICGALAYTGAALEIADQLASRGITGPVKFYGVAGRSLAGLALVAKNLGLPWSCTGVLVNFELPPDVYIWPVIGKVQKLLGLPVALTPEDLPVLTGYVGEAYGVMTPGCAEAIKLVASKEAIILDPNYTGKTMAGLIDQARKGNVKRGETVVFLHTGGLPALFSYAEELAK